MHWYWQNMGKDSYNFFFVVIFQLSYGPWLMSELCFYIISWEQIDGFQWNFVYAVLWLTHEIFLNFSTELWPLIDVKISVFLNIFRSSEWLLITFCLCIVVTNTHYFLNLFNRLMTLDWFKGYVYVPISYWWIWSGRYFDIFYAKMCATTKISTEAGYHVVLATLLFSVKMLLFIC